MTDCACQYRFPGSPTPCADYVRSPLLKDICANCGHECHRPWTPVDGYLAANPQEQSK